MAAGEPSERERWSASRLRQAIERRPGWVLAVLLSGSLAAGLVAGTWLLARWSLQSRLAAAEREIAFLRATRDIDIPRLLDEFRTFLGTANARFELEKLRVEHERLRRELGEARATLAELEKKNPLQERFSLEVGQSRTILNGTVVVGLVGLAPGYADVSFAGTPETNWRVGEYREVNFGGSRHRLVLETIPAENPTRATFRVEALAADQADGP